MVLALLVLSSSSLLGQAPPPSMSPHHVGPIAFLLPNNWRQTSRLTPGSVEYDAPDGDAFILVDARVVEKPDLTPDTCLDIIIARLAAGPSWRRKTVDRFAVLAQTVFDRSGNNASTARVESIVGCDGRFSWSMVIIMDAANWVYWSSVTGKVVQSIRGSDLQPGSPEAAKLGTGNIELPQR